jgi:uncharacterized protein YndB with AHSA1/START domain
MNTFIIVLLILAGIPALLLIVALFTRKEYHIRREITIRASPQAVFDYLKQLKNQDHFNKWVMVDPGMKRDFKGTDGTVGFIYAWNGNKQAGEGEQEIKHLSEEKRIETEIRFKRPFAAVAYANLDIEALSDTHTKVSWSNRSTMAYPMNIMVSLIEKMLAKDMDTSLLNLKTILEA